jgi:ATP-dependent Clp protease ATP-binding subunit ClpC
VILIMTSNIGAAVIKDQTTMGFSVPSPDLDHEKMKLQLQGEVERFFRPEFINRLDDVIVFRSLTKEDMVDILQIELQGIIQRLWEKDISLELTPDARDFLIEEGTNLQFGARPLRRAIERFLEDPLAEEILKNAFEGKNHVIVRLEEEKMVFEPTMRTETPDLPEVSVNST